MDIKLEKYLESIDKHLKPLPTSERIDIVKDIKNSITEMQHNNLTTEQILDRLGNPKEIAKSYLGDIVAENKKFSLEKYLAIASFYSLVGLSGVIVIPFLGIMAPVLMFCGVFVPFCGLLKLAGYIFDFNVPFVTLGMGPVELHPILGFIVTIAVGIAMYKLGSLSWKTLLSYIQGVSQKKRDLSI